MEKFVKENKDSLILFATVLAFLLAIIIVALTSKKLQNEVENMGNEYIFEDKVVELPGTKEISTDELKAEHCLDTICITDVTVYSTESEGRIECTVTNKGEESASGYLRLKFGEKGVVVHYTDISPEDSSKVVAQFKGGSLQDATDYTIEKLSKSERKNIVK